MTTKFFAAAAVLLLAAGTPAVADSGATDASQPTAKVDDAGQNKTVCRRVESIGTRLGTKRICRTKGEWDAEQAVNRQDLERSQTQRWGKAAG